MADDFEKIADDFEKRSDVNAKDLLIKFYEEKDSLHAILAFNFKLTDSGLQCERLKLCNGNGEFLEAFGRVADEAKTLLCEVLSRRLDKLEKMLEGE